MTAKYKGRECQPDAHQPAVAQAEAAREIQNPIDQEAAAAEAYAFR